MTVALYIRIIDNDKGEITAEVEGNEIRGWSYHTPSEQSRKMIMAHEFAEGWWQRDRRAVAAETAGEARSARDSSHD